MQNTKNNPIRLDAPDKARGKALYTADYFPKNMLHVVLCRAEVPHARIKGISVPPLPEGVYCYTGKDIPNNLLPFIKNDQPALAEEKVRFLGEPYAIVAADTEEKARAFAGRVRLDYEELPLVEDYISAIEPDAPKIFEDGNLCTELHSRKGDTKTAFAGCDLVLENTFEVPVQCHGFLETESAYTFIDDRGRLALISSTQNAFANRATIAQALNRPPETVFSKAATVGGAFGGKDGNTAQIFPAVVTHFTGKPAGLVFTREENIRYGMKRHRGTVWVKMGFTAEGLLQAFAGKMWLDTGAYAILGPPVLELGVEHMTGPYYCPNIDLDGWLAYTNHAPSSAMRGFGGPQGALAVETLMNEAAEKLGVSPLEIRRKNAIHRGQSGPMGATMDYSVGFEEALQKFEQSDFYKEMQNPPDKSVGYGIAAGMMSSGMGKGVWDTGTAEIEQCEDGHYLVRVGMVDIGQGSETALAMMASRALGVDLEQIEMRMGNTDEAIDSGSTAASRTTYLLGNAVLAAAKEIKAGKKKGLGVFSFPEVAENNGIHTIFAFIMQGVKVRIDPISGAVQMLDAYNVTEAGRILHPDMLAGQIFGGIAMSTGYALSEQVRWDNGAAMEDGFNAYVLPTALDAPHMINENAEIDEETGPFGTKGMAEAATVALAPAISAAVKSLCPGICITKIPLDRENILRHLQGEEKA